MTAARRQSHGETPLEHWSKESSYSAQWVRRAERVAQLVQPNAIVCDIGCGRQDLRRLLPEAATYLPADLKQWTSDTELCDLNKGVLPLRSLRQCDTCVLLGVLTYVLQPAELLLEIAKYARTLILTYNVTDWASFRHPLWVNRHSLNEIVSFVTRAGYRVARTEKFGSTAIVQAVKVER